ncbi:tripartite tricarboxylate transporter TctB family protein [Mycobacterium sp. NPDC003449]
MTVDRTTGTAKPAAETGDWIITGVLLVIMVMAFIATREWPSNAAFFPRLLSGLGIGLTTFRLLTLLRAVIAQRGTRRPAPEETPVPQASDADGKSIVIEGPDSDEEGDEHELHDIFAEADLRTWAGVIGWFMLFFAGLYLVGFLAILVIFTVAYLRVVERTKYWHCALYVAGTAGVIYLLFVVMLHLPLPLGLLTSAVGF